MIILVNYRVSNLTFFPTLSTLETWKCFVCIYWNVFCHFLSLLWVSRRKFKYFLKPLNLAKSIPFFFTQDLLSGSKTGLLSYRKKLDYRRRCNDNVSLFWPSQEHFVIVTFGMEKRKNVLGQQILSFHMFENVFSSKYEENRKLKRRLHVV